MAKVPEKATKDVKIPASAHRQLKDFCVEHGFQLGRFMAQAAIIEMGKARYKKK